MNAQQARELTAAGQQKLKEKVYSTIEAMAKSGKLYATFDWEFTQELKDELIENGYSIEQFKSYTTINW